jgi:hypothetical protein
MCPKAHWVHPYTLPGAEECQGNRRRGGGISRIVGVQMIAAVETRKPLRWMGGISQCGNGVRHAVELLRGANPMIDFACLGTLFSSGAGRSNAAAREAHLDHVDQAIA